MTIWAAILSVILGLAVNECWEVSAWAAKKVARWSARLRYDDLERAEIRGEELVALIEVRPGKLLKLITALCFAAAAVRAWTRRTAASLYAAIPAVSDNGTVALKKAAVAAVAGTVAFAAVLTVETAVTRAPVGVPGIHQGVPPAAYLADLTGDTSSSSTLPVVGLWMINAMRYAHSVGFTGTCGPDTVIYHLNGRYQWFQATVGMDDSAELDQQAEFIVYANPGGGPLRIISEMTASVGNPVKIRVSITGSTSLVIKTDDCLSSPSAAVWGNASLVQ